MKKVLLLGMGLVASPLLLAAEVDEHLEIIGKYEVEYANVHSAAGNRDGTTLGIGELGVIVKPNDKVNVMTSWIYEGKVDAADADKTPFENDEAYVQFHALPDEKLDIIAGKQYLPFGKFDSAMITDPLTLQMGETRKDKALVVSSKQGKFSGKVYGFDSDSSNIADGKKFGTGYGAGVGFDGKVFGKPFAAGVDYISNIAEAGGFADGDVSRKIPAVTYHSTSKWGRVTFNSETMAALKALEPGDLGGNVATSEKPAASRSEVAFDLHNDRTIAATWNATRHAQALGLDKRYAAVVYRQPIYKDLQGAVEWRESKSYADEKARTLTVQVAYEF
jgi:hypothetical protein